MAHRFRIGVGTQSQFVAQAQIEGAAGAAQAPGLGEAQRRLVSVEFDPSAGVELMAAAAAALGRQRRHQPLQGTAASFSVSAVSRS